MEKTKTRKNKSVKICVSDTGEPFFIDSSSNLKPDFYNSVFTTLFERAPATTFSLKKSEEKLPTFSFIHSGDFQQCDSKNHYLGFISKNLDIDKRFIELYEEGLPIPQNMQPEQILQYFLQEKIVDVTNYLPTIFLQRILTLSIIDIIKDKGANQFTVSVVNCVDFSNSRTLFRQDVVVNSIIDVIINVFGEACLWEDSSDPEEFPEFDIFIGLLSSMIIKSKNNMKFLRKIICPFCPSAFAESFIKALINKLQTRLIEIDVFGIISQIFGEKWIINCFRTRESLTKFVLSGNIINILPYVGVYCLTCQWCYADSFESMKMIAKNVACSISQIGSFSLFASKRIARSVLYPLLDSIYEYDLDFDLPYLEMSEEQKVGILIKLETSIPILKETIMKQRLVQLHSLDYIVKYLSKRRFEPKGMALILFSFLSDNNIIHPTVFNSWMTISPESQGKYSALLEVNSLLMTLIPGSFPTTSKNDFINKKTQNTQ